jgi:cytochrome b
VHEPGQASREPSGELTRSGNSERVLVWDWPLRAWHWALVVFVLIAWFTPSRYDSLHRFAGYVVIGLLVFRVGWGFLGTRYSRFRAVRPRLRAAPAYLWGLRHGNTGRYMGLNPAGAAMMVALLSLLAISTITGAMQVTVRFFGVWWVEDTHTYSSDALMILVVLHVIGTILMSVVQRENLVWAMFTGRKLRRTGE